MGFNLEKQLFATLFLAVFLAKNHQKVDVTNYRWQQSTVYVEPCFLGCTDDEDCQGNRICGDNGRCSRGEKQKLLVITVYVEPCFL